MNRRQFLKAGASAGICALTCGASKGAEASKGEIEFDGVLVDTTRCLGCRKCEAACAKENGLPVPDIDDTTIIEKERTTDVTSWTIVNRYKTEKGTFNVKRQCMHCNQPACAAACLVKAMLKKKDGPVIWRESKCMGCRYCMISCPFDVPKFEYNSVNPKIQKCNLCFNRLEKGKKPACVEACPAEALLFGKRRNILENARKRISKNPDKYHNHIYGEKVAGGTSWLYLSSVPFDQIGFKTNLSMKPYPEYTKGFLYGVPVIFVLWPAFLLGINHITRKAEEIQKIAEQGTKKETK